MGHNERNRGRSDDAHAVCSHVARQRARDRDRHLLGTNTAVWAILRARRGLVARWTAQTSHSGHRPRFGNGVEDDPPHVPTALEIRRYGSEGKWRPIRDDGHDGADLLKWIAEQPWSNGK